MSTVLSFQVSKILEPSLRIAAPPFGVPTCTPPPYIPALSSLLALPVAYGGSPASTPGMSGKVLLFRASLLHHSQPLCTPRADTAAAVTASTHRRRHCAAVVQFVLDLNDQYAPTLVKLQDNATFELGELFQQGTSAAVHIFASAFDSLLGPQFRYEISESTAYCGSPDDVVPSAVQLATSNGPDVVVDSAIANSNSNLAPRTPAGPTGNSAMEDREAVLGLDSGSGSGGGSAGGAVVGTETSRAAACGGVLLSATAVFLAAMALAA